MNGLLVPEQRHAYGKYPKDNVPDIREDVIEVVDAPQRMSTQEIMVANVQISS